MIFVVAGIGPFSIVTGSVPATAKLWNRARGRRPSSAAFSALMISTADAPSVICDELPAVILPSSLKAGLSLASVSAVVPSRMPSSAVIISALPSTSIGTGTISLSNRPSSAAWAARRWLSAPNASRSSRVRPYSSAIISAPMPCGGSPVSA